MLVDGSPYQFFKKVSISNSPQEHPMIELMLTSNTFFTSKLDILDELLEPGIGF